MRVLQILCVLIGINLLESVLGLNNPQVCRKYHSGYDLSKNKNCQPGVLLYGYTNWCPDWNDPSTEKLKLYLKEYQKQIIHNMGMEHSLLLVDWIYLYAVDGVPCDTSHFNYEANEMVQELNPGVGNVCDYLAQIDLFIFTGTQQQLEIDTQKYKEFGKQRTIDICIGTSCNYNGHPEWDLQVDTLDELPTSSSSVYKSLAQTYCNEMDAFPMVDINDDTGRRECHCYCRNGYKDNGNGNCIRATPVHKCPWNKCYEVSVNPGEDCPIQNLFGDSNPIPSTPFPMDNAISEIYAEGSDSYVQIRYAKSLVNADKSDDSHPLEESSRLKWRQYRQDPATALNDALNGYISGFGRYYVEVYAYDGRNDEFCAAEIVLVDKRPPTLNSCNANEDRPYNKDTYNEIKAEITGIQTTQVDDDQCGSISYDAEYQISTKITPDEPNLVYASDDIQEAIDLCSEFSEKEANLLKMQSCISISQGKTMEKCCDINRILKSEKFTATCENDEILDWDSSRRTYTELDSKSCTYHSCASLSLCDFFTSTASIKDPINTETDRIKTKHAVEPADTEDIHFEVGCDHVGSDTSNNIKCYHQATIQSLLHTSIDWHSDSDLDFHNLKAFGKANDYTSARYRLTYGGVKNDGAWLPFDPAGSSNVDFDTEIMGIHYEVWTHTGRCYEISFTVRVHPHVPFDPCAVFEKKGVKIDLDLVRDDGTICNLVNSDFTVIQLEWESVFGQEDAETHVYLKEARCKAGYGENQKVDILTKTFTQPETERFVDHFGVQLRKNDPTNIYFSCDFEYVSGFVAQCTTSRQLVDCDDPYFSDTADCQEQCAIDGNSQLLDQMCLGNQIEYNEESQETVYISKTVTTPRTCCSKCGPTECQPVGGATNPVDLSRCVLSESPFLSLLGITKISSVKDLAHVVLVGCMFSMIIIGLVTLRRNARRSRRNDTEDPLETGYEPLLS